MAIRPQYTNAMPTIDTPMVDPATGMASDQYRRKDEIIMEVLFGDGGDSLFQVTAQLSDLAASIEDQGERLTNIEGVLNALSVDDLRAQVQQLAELVANLNSRLGTIDDQSREFQEAVKNIVDSVIGQIEGDKQELAARIEESNKEVSGLAADISQFRSQVAPETIASEIILAGLNVPLGANTKGDYVEAVTAGTGVTLNGTATGEGATPEIAIGQDVATGADVEFNTVNAATHYEVAGTQVVGAQEPAIADVAIAPTAADHNAILAVLRAHGLIAT